MMQRFIRLTLLASLVVPACGVGASADDCLDAAAKAERQYDIPSGLLAAIGEVESGRRDPLSGRVQPWPWTIDRAGAGLYLPDAKTAVKTLVSLQAGGGGPIDVGCFQIDLSYHPNAFATPSDAFNPDANADFAARFLADLHRRLGSWPAAVAAYHSGAPILGVRYRDRVLSLWHGLALPEPRFGMTIWTPDSPMNAGMATGGPRLPNIILPDMPVSGG